MRGDLRLIYKYWRDFGRSVVNDFNRLLNNLIGIENIVELTHNQCDQVNYNIRFMWKIINYYSNVIKN